MCTWRSAQLCFSEAFVQDCVVMARPLSKDVMADALEGGYLREHADSDELRAKLESLVLSDRETADPKKYLSTLKQVLQSRPLSDVGGLLLVLVPIYIQLDNKNTAKKVLSSFFQGLPHPHYEKAREILCQGTRKACEQTAEEDNPSPADVRAVIDLLSALMDNFALGEECIRLMAFTAVEFLSKAQRTFLKLFRTPNQSAVQLNTTMHDCHMTMQVLNRLTQRHLPKDADLAQKLNIAAVQSIVQNNIVILMEEQMMADCRCCCAMSLVLLLQLLCPDGLIQVVRNTLDSHSIHPQLPDWLQNVGLENLRIRSLMPMSALALLWGVLSMLSADALTVEVNPFSSSAPSTHSSGGCNGTECVSPIISKKDMVVCEALLGELMWLDGQCQATASRVQCVKTVHLWTTRMRSLLEDTSVAEGVKARFVGHGHTVSQLLQFVWTHWQNQLDVVRQNCRLIFDACLQLHVLASQTADPSHDPFLLSVLHQMLEVSWTNHGKFGCLISLVRYLGSKPLLASQADFPVTLLCQMQDQGTACHASELYEALIKSDRQLPSEQGDADTANSWLQVWIDPIVAVLCGGNKKVKQHVIEYVLPRVMKSDKLVLEHMLHKLTSSDSTDMSVSGHLGALVVCLRRARAWGLMSQSLNMQDSSASVWSSIQRALSSPEEQVRLDAFALLCENKRTSEPVTQVEFDHLRHFISSNLNNQSPAFRQSMLAFIKKLFFRLNESQGALMRQKKKQPKSEDALALLASYQEFLKWLEDFLFCQLYPYSAFARRTMSLSILSLLVQNIHSDKGGEGFRPLASVTVNHIQTLLECLTDTFEENKMEAFSLLVACINIRKNLLTEDHCKALYSAALKLAVSTRPQDCGTAAYLLRFLMHLPCASHIIQACKPELQSSTQSAESQVFDEMLAGMDDLPVEMRLLCTLLRLLVDQVAVAGSSLIVAAANRPMYPTLHCIRYLLQDVKLGSVKETYKKVWQKYFGRLLQVCLQVAEVVSPVVQNSSPEGNVPEEAVLGPGLKFDLGLMAEVEESRQTVTLMPEYLIVCCWRSIKEVSLLLGHLCQNVPVTQPGVSQGMFTLKQVEEIGGYFKQQLMESLHRGAFELAYAGFVMMCHMLWKSPWSQLQALPQRWLQEVMTAITATDGSSQLCATRRSAGVPFFVQAIVATETGVSGRPSFHQAMSQLIHIALSSTSEGGITDSHVHALNIMRALFRDTRLGDDGMPYISDGMKAAILGFKSSFWEVRNSSTLLLSALMTRVFGVKRSKDDSILCKRNSQTGRAFFHKYPELYQFLLTELDLATQNLGTSGHLHLHPSLYPVLMVLGRLFPSTMEGTSTRLNLAAFIPYVIRCASSPVYKTRMMAARALQPLVAKDQVTQVMTSLLEQLPQKPQSEGEVLSQSLVHGLLLQIHSLLSLTPDLSVTLLQNMMAVCMTMWPHHLWLITRENHCPMSRKVALDITDIILSSSSTVTALLSPEHREKLQDTFSKLCDILQTEASTETAFYNPHTPFLSEFLSNVATLALKHSVCDEKAKERGDFEMQTGVVTQIVETGASISELGAHLKQSCDESTVLRLLNSSAYEVHMAVLDFLHGGTCMLFLDKPVFDHLLAMGLCENGHAETVIKVFELLSSVHVAPYLEDDDHPKIFEKLVQKLHREKRADVQAAVLRFAGHLFPGVYSGIKKEASGMVDLLHSWTETLKSFCEAEQPDELQLSCACFIRDNALPLLIDAEQHLGELVFEFWGLLVTLLQADDLEVKEVAASVYSRLSSQESGHSHPEECLKKAVCLMLSLHGKTRPLQCVLTALHWLQTDAAAVAEESSERLFDKGEMNTFRDDIAFAKVITDSLKSPTLSEGKAQDGTKFSESSGHGIPSKGPSEAVNPFNPIPPSTHLSGGCYGPKGVNFSDKNGKDFAQEITDIICDMDNRVSRILATDISSVFSATPKYADDMQLLIKVAVIADSLVNVLADSKFQDAAQKLMYTVRTTVNRLPVCGVLLHTLVGAY